jgi:hypothetical protein
VKKKDSTFHINPGTEAEWTEATKQLPEKITINGEEYDTSDLPEKTKKLALIYMNDSSILSQFKELIALAELGLSSIIKEIQDSINEKS